MIINCNVLIKRVDASSFDAKTRQDTLDDFNKLKDVNQNLVQINSHWVVHCYCWLLSKATENRID